MGGRRASVDLGSVFGSWTIVEAINETRTRLRARCACGNETIQRSGYFLRDGRSGCKACYVGSAMSVKNQHFLRAHAKTKKTEPASTPEAIALPRETEPLPFSVGDEVRARGVRGVVTQTRVDAVLVRGIAGWIQVDEVEDVE